MTQNLLNNKLYLSSNYILSFVILNDSIYSGELKIETCLKLNSNKIDFNKEYSLSEIEELYENTNDS
jgi:hypothetical protein